MVFTIFIKVNKGEVLFYYVPNDKNKVPTKRPTDVKADISQAE